MTASSSRDLGQEEEARELIDALRTQLAEAALSLQSLQSSASTAAAEAAAAADTLRQAEEQVKRNERGSASAPFCQALAAAGLNGTLASRSGAA